MHPLEMQQRRAVVDEALSWVGTGYHHAARLKGVGVDCAMLLAEVYERSGIIPRVDPEPYPPDWHLHRDKDRFREWLERFARPVKSPLPGDVAAYRFGRATSHGAIVVAWPGIVHAAIGCGVIRDVGDGGEIGPRLTGFWRFHQWEDDDA